MTSLKVNLGDLIKKVNAEYKAKNQKPKPAKAPKKEISIPAESIKTKKETIKRTTIYSGRVTYRKRDRDLTDPSTWSKTERDAYVLTGRKPAE